MHDFIHVYLMVMPSAVRAQLCIFIVWVMGFFMPCSFPLIKSHTLSGKYKIYQGKWQ